MRRGPVSPSLLALTYANSRRDRLPDGRYLDIFVDQLFTSGKLQTPVFVIEHPNQIGHLSPIAGQRDLYADPLILATKFTKRLRSPSPEMLAAAKGLVDVLIANGAAEAWSNLTDIVTTTISEFEATRRVYRWVMERQSICAFLVIDADAWCGAVAAAKELGVPVLELQHGHIAAEQVGYHWDKTLKPFRRDMPLPDRFLVFGPLWQRLMMSHGFWNPGDIVAVGSAQIDRYRESTVLPSDDRLKLVFTTQWPSRDHALGFLGAFVEQAMATFDRPVELAIKVHPSERKSIGSYRALETRFPGVCRVVPAEAESTFAVIKAAHIHLSYVSTSLIEALALGVPSISLCGGAWPEGFRSISSLPTVDAALPHVKTPGELRELIANNMPGSEQFARWQHSVEEVGSDLFLPGFVEEAAQAINALLPAP